MLSRSYVKLMSGDDLPFINTYCPPQICIILRKENKSAFLGDFNPYFTNLTPCEAACYVSMYDSLDLVRENYQLIVGRWWIDWITTDTFLMEDIIIEALCEQHENCEEVIK